MAYSSWDDVLYKSKSGGYAIKASAARNGVTVDSATKQFGALPAKYAGQVSGYNPALAKVNDLEDAKLATKLGLVNSSGTGTAARGNALSQPAPAGPDNALNSTPRYRVDDGPVAPFRTDTVSTNPVAARIRALEEERRLLIETSNKMGGLASNAARILEIDREWNTLNGTQSGPQSMPNEPTGSGMDQAQLTPQEKGVLQTKYSNLIKLRESAPEYERASYNKDLTEISDQLESGIRKVDPNAPIDQMYGAALNSPREFGAAEVEAAKLAEERRIAAERFAAIGAGTGLAAGGVMTAAGALSGLAAGGAAGAAAAVPSAGGAIVAPGLGGAAGTVGAAGAGAGIAPAVAGATAAGAAGGGLATAAGAAAPVAGATAAGAAAGGLTGAVAPAVGGALAGAAGGGGIDWAGLTAILGSGMYGASQGKEAAQIQADAANKAADLQYKATVAGQTINQQQFDAAMARDKAVYDEQITRQQPWMQAGAQALGQLQRFDQDNPAFQAGPDFQAGAAFDAGPAFQAGQAFDAGPAWKAGPEFKADPFSFNTEGPNMDPSYAFRFNEGMKALQNSAAAKGMLRSGNTMKAITQYGQGMASTEYENAFNRYQTDTANRYGRYNTDLNNSFNMNQADTTNRYNRYNSDLNNRFNMNQTETGNRYNRYNTDLNNRYNMYNTDISNKFNMYQSQRGQKLNAMQSLAGVGQSSVQQMNQAGSNYANSANQSGQNYANNAGQYGMTGANAQAGGLTNAASANASGVMGQSNAITNAIGGAINYNQSSSLMNALMNRR